MGGDYIIVLAYVELGKTLRKEGWIPGASPAELICIQGVDKDSLGTKSGVQGKRRALETESQE